MSAHHEHDSRQVGAHRKKRIRQRLIEMIDRVAEIRRRGPRPVCLLILTRGHHKREKESIHRNPHDIDTVLRANKFLVEEPDRGIGTPKPNSKYFHDSQYPEV